MAILVKSYHPAAIARDLAAEGSGNCVANATAGSATNRAGSSRSLQAGRSAVPECQIARLKALNEECKRKIRAERERLAQYKAKIDAVLDAYYGIQ